MQIYVIVLKREYYILMVKDRNALKYVFNRRQSQRKYLGGNVGLSALNFCCDVLNLFLTVIILFILVILRFTLLF